MQISHFARMVRTGARFDLKRPGGGYSPENLKGRFAIYNGHIMRFDDFGNYNFGVAASAFGLPLYVVLGGAGIAQIFDNGGDLTNPGGFFDEGRDTPMIINGYNHAFEKQ